MRRRDLLLGGAIACSVGAIAGAPAVLASKKFRWRMVTSWPPNFPVFQTGAERFAKQVYAMSGGRLSIKVFAGGELVPPLGVFDAVSQGGMQMGHSGAVFWAGKAPATQFFSSIPFGMTGQQMNAWLYYGGGLELWNEVYAPFNIVVFPACNTGVQMGGWFNKKIGAMADFGGLKMRIPGLGGKVLSKVGVNVVLLPAGELYMALERGVIDAVEWAGPYHDLQIGFHRAARYYYYPGWHEPGSAIELLVNRKAWESLPKDLQTIVSVAAAQSNLLGLSEFDAKNGLALNDLVTKYNVRVLQFPAEIIRALHKLSAETLEQIAAQDPMFSKVYSSFKTFAGKIDAWTEIGEKAYMEAPGG